MDGIPLLSLIAGVPLYLITRSYDAVTIVTISYNRSICPIVRKANRGTLFWNKNNFSGDQIDME